MIVLSGALVLVALVLLVFGAVDRNLPYVYASIGVSLLSLLLLLVSILQRRGALPGEDDDVATTPVTDTSSQPEPALVGAAQRHAGAGQADVTAELPAAVDVPVDEPARPASRRVVSDVPAEDRFRHEPEGVEEWDVEDELGDDEPDGVDEDEELGDDVQEDEELVDLGSGVTVLVVSGRPRYHLEGCRVLRGKEPQPLDRDDARTHGFSPCGVCKPDADETAAQQQSEAAAQPADDRGSFTEALFGEPIFAEQPERRSLEPASPEPVGQAHDAEPAVREHAVAAQDSEPLRGDDPADEAAPEVEEAAAPEPDVAADPDVQVDEQVERDPADPEAGVEEPVAVDGVPVADAVPPATTEGAEAEPAIAEGADAELTPEQAAAPEADGPEAAQPPDHGVRTAAPPVQAPPAAAAATTERAPEAVVPPPAETAPRKRTASKRTGAASAPAAQAADPDAPTTKAGARTASASAAAGTAPAKKAPAKKAPAKKAPAKKAPARTSTDRAAAAPASPPQAKRPLVRTVRADALRLGAPSTGVTTTRVSARAAAPAAGASVVVVPDRDRFHRPQCRFVRDVAGATTLPKTSAARQGYAACGVCKP